MKIRRNKKREQLFEAFLGGWQAALAVNIRNPQVIAVIEDCYDMWLETMADEVDILGVTFRRRLDLPGSRQHLLRQAAAPEVAPAAPVEGRAADGSGPRAPEQQPERLRWDGLPIPTRPVYSFENPSEQPSLGSLLQPIRRVPPPVVEPEGAPAVVEPRAAPAPPTAG